MIELLAPAGDYNKMRTAIHFGADAVYLSGSKFGLRAKAKNFDGDELRETIRYAHERGKKVYVTTNIFASNDDFLELRDYFPFLYEIGADAVIISDQVYCH